MKPRLLFALILTTAALVGATVTAEDAAHPRDGVFAYPSWRVPAA